MANGVSFVCAHCDNFWWGVERGLEGCKAVEDKKDCSGPIRSKGFPEYSGPLKGYLHKFCFVCGIRATKGIMCSDGRFSGVCNVHVDILENFSSGIERPAFVSKVALPLVK